MADPGRQEALHFLALRFLLVGILNTGFGYTCFAALILAGAGSTVALVLGTAAGIIFNTQTSQRMVFHARVPAGRLVAINVTILALNWLLLQVAAWLNVGSLLAQAVLVLPFAMLSFFCQKYLVFASACSPE